MKNKEFLTVKQAVESYGLSAGTICNLGKRRLVTMYRDSSSSYGALLFEKEELDDYFKLLKKTPEWCKVPYKIINNSSEAEIAKRYLRYMRFLKVALGISEELALSVVLANPDGVDTAIEEALGSLNSKRIVTVLRLRLFDDNQTLEEVGMGFSVTRERIRQLEIKGLRSLRHPARRGKLAMSLGLAEYFKDNNEE